MTVTNSAQIEAARVAREAITAAIHEAYKRGVDISALINDVTSSVISAEQERENAVEDFRDAFFAFQKAARMLREAWESEHVNPMAVENYPEGWETFEEEELKIASMELGQVEL